MARPGQSVAVAKRRVRKYNREVEVASKKRVFKVRIRKSR